MPFTGTDEIHMRAPTCKYADSKSGFNDMVGIEIRYRQGNLAVFFFIEVTEGAEVVSRSGMEMNVRSPVLSYRHLERCRGIFYVAAVLCTYEVMIKSPRCFGCSSSDALRLIVVQGRFLALLEMTIWGKAVFSYRSLLHGEAAFSLLPMEGGAPKGQRLESPRYEREYEESVLSYRHPVRSERSLPFAVRDSRFLHMCRALLRFSHLSFIPLEPYPARYARHLPHAGKALSVVILFPHMRVFALTLWGSGFLVS